MNERISEIRSAIEEADLSDEAREALIEEVDAVEEELEDVGEAMGRANRSGRTGGMENWSGLPTADQLWSIQATWDEIPGVIEDVNTLLTDRMPALEGRIAEAGLRPAAGKPVEVPRRP
jgi:hypothetical protein